MKMCFIIFAIALFFRLPGTAQSTDFPTKQQSLHALGTYGNQGAIQTFNNRYEGVKGTPYFFEEWTRGRVLFRDGTVYDDIPLRYDVHNDQLIAQRSKESIVIVFKTLVQEFSLGKPENEIFLKFTKAAYLEDLKHMFPNHYVRVMYKGATSLYAVYWKSLIRADYRRAYNAGRPYDAFAELKAKYYITLPGGETVLAKPRKNALARIFKDHRKKVKSFIEENNLVLDHGTDLIKIIAYYDQLNQ